MPHLEKYPCHTQAVKRHIKVVTDTEMSICGKNPESATFEQSCNQVKRCTNVLKMNENHNVNVTKLYEGCTITISDGLRLSGYCM